MKIAFVSCVFPPQKSGMATSAYHFSRISAALGNEAVVFTPLEIMPRGSVAPKLRFGIISACFNALREFLTGFTPQYFKVNREDEENKKNDKLKVVRLKTFLKYGNAAILPQLIWRLAGFDIIYLHYPFYGAAEFVLLYKFLARKKTKLIIHFHMEPAARGAKGLVFNLSRLLLRPLLFRAADIITCASLDYVKRSGLSKYYQKNKNKFREISFGVDLNNFKPAPAKQKERDGYKTILFVGGLDRAHYFKGVDVLIKAVSKLLTLPAGRQVDSFQLLIVGDGDLRAEYEGLAKKLGIDDKVIFAGRVADRNLPAYYNNCDVLVLPSINQGEAFGIVLLEAMASGKPVIASDLPGVRGVFQNGKQGLLARPGDAGDLTEKIRIILSDENLAKKMGQEGRKLAEEKYDWRKVGQKLNEIYENMFNK
jgi:glycosyltransferase involved in cell wall biosynthesis